ncbi:transglycosylase SLT domain-containing protein [Candidatus Woesearchaeota archaeon]|nr:transglycosylase SLT domain-containing protein [Candidatus Woesearchaeota archaeon]
MGKRNRSRSVRMGMKNTNKIWILAVIVLLFVVIDFKVTGMAAVEDRYDSVIKVAAEEHDTSFALVKAVIKQESGFDPEAVSPTGCKGLAQFCSAAAVDYGLCDKEGCSIRDDRLDPEKSIYAAAEYLNDLTNVFKGYTAKYEFALASYNGGVNVVKRAIEATGENNPTWATVSAALEPEMITYFSEQEDKENKVREIRNYVDRIMKYYENYGGEIIKESAGIYAVRPSFEISVDYDFSDYDKIRQGIQELKEECIEKGSLDIEECIKTENRRLSADGFEWSLGSCDRRERAFFYSFVKSYEECYFSANDDCVCRGEPYKGDDITGEYTMEFTDSGLYQVYMKGYEAELPGRLNYVDKGIILDPSALDWEFTIDKGKITKSNIKPNYGSFDISNFNFYKKDGKIAFMTKEWGMTGKQNCKTTQEHFQFCVTNNNRKFPKIDEEGKLSIEPVVYKFAVKFEDTVAPPKIMDLDAADMEKAEKSLNLTWSKSEAADVNHYNIYISEESFDNITKANNIINVSSDDESISVRINISEDDKTYYLAVSAVDNSGNELEEAEAKEGISLDDLRPERPEVTSRINAEGKLEFEIILPDKNEDGTNITEQEILTVYAMLMPGEDICDDRILQVQKDEVGQGKKEEKMTYAITYEKGCYGFIVKDEKGKALGILDRDDIILVNIIQIYETQ